MESYPEFDTVSMAGLYVHVPFCRKKCRYCDFYSVHASDDMVGLYLNALFHEVYFYKGIYPPTGSSIGTIYIGGGTPTTLNPAQIGSLIRHVKTHYPVVSDAEVTMEVNPGSVTADLLMQYRASGVNRLSVGIQSFDPDVLRCLGRIHTADEAECVILSALQAGFDDVGIDLIYGIPNQSAVSWDATLSKALLLNPSHISAYALSWSQATPLGRDIASGRYPQPDEKTVSDMYLSAHERLTKGGYEHYEISNFARPGHRCRHNETYWTGEPYLGVGPSAHSYTKNRRFWNIPDVRRYINVLSQNRLPVAGQEDLNTGQRILEQIALGLRRQEGIALSCIVGRDCVPPLVDAGLAIVQEGKVSLTANGFLLADEIALRLAS